MIFGRYFLKFNRVRLGDPEKIIAILTAKIVLMTLE